MIRAHAQDALACFCRGPLKIGASGRGRCHRRLLAGAFFVLFDRVNAWLLSRKTNWDTSPIWVGVFISRCTGSPKHGLGWPHWTANSPPSSPIEAPAQSLVQLGGNHRVKALLRRPAPNACVVRTWHAVTWLSGNQPGGGSGKGLMEAKRLLDPRFSNGRTGLDIDMIGDGDTPHLSTLKGKGETRSPARHCGVGNDLSAQCDQALRSLTTAEPSLIPEHLQLRSPACCTDREYGAALLITQPLRGRFDDVFYCLRFQQTDAQCPL